MKSSGYDSVLFLRERARYYPLDSTMSQIWKRTVSCNRGLYRERQLSEHERLAIATTEAEQRLQEFANRDLSFTRKAQSPLAEFCVTPLKCKQAVWCSNRRGGKPLGQAALP